MTEAAVRSFDEARAVAMNWAEPGWDPGRGILWAADSGQEDEFFYRVVLGAHEHLVDGDLTYAVSNEPVILVLKSTGQVYPTDFAAAEEGLSRMIPVGRGAIRSPAAAEAAVSARLARRKKTIKAKPRRRG